MVVTIWNNRGNFVKVYCCMQMDEIAVLVKAVETFCKEFYLSAESFFNFYHVQITKI